MRRLHGDYGGARRPVRDIRNEAECAEDRLRLHIEIGEELSDLPGVHAPARFVEKPDAVTAASLAFSGRHLWNSGMFVFAARTPL